MVQPLSRQPESISSAAQIKVLESRWEELSLQDEGMNRS
jgi:hypothetical protein